MNRKSSKPKILLPKKLAPLRESVDDRSQTTLEDGQEDLPLSSTLVEGRTGSARRLKRALEEDLSEIADYSVNQSNHQNNSILQESENKENSVAPDEMKKCGFFKRNKTRLSKCAGSSVDPDVSESNGSKSVNAPLCSSFRQDISQIPSHKPFGLEETVYNLRSRKIVGTIQEESGAEQSTLEQTSDDDSSSESEFEFEDEESTLKPASDLDSISEESAPLVPDSTPAEIVVSTTRAIKRFKCEDCEKSFTSNGGLKRHQKIVHEGKRNFICVTCGMAFGRKGTLYNHQKGLHEGRRDYICSTCGIGFVTRGNLCIHHKTVHERRKDHICSTCGKAFGQKSHLTVHMYTHGNQRLFACASCDKKFKHPTTLRLHKANAHQKSRIVDSK